VTVRGSWKIVGNDGEIVDGLLKKQAVNSQKSVCQQH
jgi:hypothetical protein